MKQAYIIIAMLVFTACSLPAQGKTIHFKKLQEFLPEIDIENFQRLKPGGTTQTMMGISTSEAEVRYESIPSDTISASGTDACEPSITIDIKISDVAAVPYSELTFQSLQDFKNETEDSSQKSITIRGKYRGKEEIYTGTSKLCKLEFFIANRFIIRIEMRSTDTIKIIYDLVNTMHLEKLEKLAVRK